MTEAQLKKTDKGWLAPDGDGWYVLNAKDAKWLSNEMGGYCNFEGDTGFPEFGLNLNHLPPGAPMAMYHHEPHQEGFLVLEGEAILIVEGEEHRLKQWDYVHLPATVPHVIVGAGDGALVLAAGSRVGGGGATYPADDAAARFGASVETETSEPREAYVHYSSPEPSPYPGGLLPE